MVLGIMSYNREPLVPPNIRNILIYVVLTFIVGFLIYYYMPKKKH